MSFASILYPPLHATRAAGTTAAPSHEFPEFFHDLNLDQIVSTITSGWKEYDLVPFFLDPPTDLETIAYRQGVMRDLDGSALLSHIETFANGMRDARQARRLAAELEYPYERERWFLNAAHAYCEAVEGLSRALPVLDLRSDGMSAFREYVTSYVATDAFRIVAEDASALLADLASVRYGLLIRDTSVTVLPPTDEPDYEEALTRTFARFDRSTVPASYIRGPAAGRLNHVDAQVLEGVARLYPAVFRALDAFFTRHPECADAIIEQFDREIQFYVAYLSHMRRLARAGLQFCLPRVSVDSKEERARDTFDLALASTQRTVVTNDYSLHDPERIIVVTGPNQGGKTTCARTYGQIHYLASLGLPVPGSDAHLFLCDRIFTHFERSEEVETLRGRLEMDLVRVKQILDAATPRSIVILNEIFAATIVDDALYLSRKVMADLSSADLLAVIVTFLDELASFDDKTVSLVATVDEHDPTVHTFKVERRPPDGIAHALALAAKYRVTDADLRERIAG